MPRPESETAIIEHMNAEIERITGKPRKTMEELSAEIGTWYDETDGIKHPKGYTFDDLNKFASCGADYDELQYALLGAGCEVDKLLARISELEAAAK